MKIVVPMMSLKKTALLLVKATNLVTCHLPLLDAIISVLLADNAVLSPHVDVHHLTLVDNVVPSIHVDVHPIHVLLPLAHPIHVLLPLAHPIHVLLLLVLLVLSHHVYNAVLSINVDAHHLTHVLPFHSQNHFLFLDRVE